MLLAGCEVDDIAGVDIDDRLAFFLGASYSGYDVEDLSLRVDVLVGARAGLKEDAEDAGIGGWAGWRCGHPHGAGEPLLGTATGLCVFSRNYLHGCLLTIGVWLLDFR